MSSHYQNYNIMNETTKPCYIHLQDYDNGKALPADKSLYMANGSFTTYTLPIDHKYIVPANYKPYMFDDDNPLPNYKL